jgi:hypothetical protein
MARTMCVHRIRAPCPAAAPELPAAEIPSDWGSLSSSLTQIIEAPLQHIQDVRFLKN